MSLFQLFFMCLYICLYYRGGGRDITFACFLKQKPFQWKDGGDCLDSANTAGIFSFHCHFRNYLPVYRIDLSDVKEAYQNVAL